MLKSERGSGEIGTALALMFFGGFCCGVYWQATYGEKGIVEMTNEKESTTLTTDQWIELGRSTDREDMIARLEAHKSAGRIKEYKELEDGSFEVAPMVVLRRINIRFKSNSDVPTP